MAGITLTLNITLTLHVGSFLCAAFRHRSSKVLADFSATFPRPGVYPGQVRVHGSDRANLLGLKVHSQLTYQFPIMYCTWAAHSLRTVKLRGAIQMIMLAWRGFFGILPLTFVHFCALKVHCVNPLFNVSAAGFWCGLPCRGWRQEEVGVVVQEPVV